MAPLHLFLVSTPYPIFAYKLTIFGATLGFFFSARPVLGHLLRVDRPLQDLFSLVLVLAPVFAARESMVMMHYYVALALMGTSLRLLLPPRQRVENWRSFLKLVLSCVLIVVASNVEVASTVFIALVALIHWKQLESWRGRFLFSLPMAAAVAGLLGTVFAERSAFYAANNVLSPLPLWKWPFESVRALFHFLVIGPSNVFMRMDSVPLGVLLAAVACIFATWSSRVFEPHFDRLRLPPRKFLIATGLALFLAAVVPFYAAGKYVSSRDWNSRGFIFAAPAFLAFLLAILPQHGQHRARTLAWACSIFLVLQLITRLDFYRDGLKHANFATLVREDPQIKSGDIIVSYDATDFWNAANRLVRYYEYAFSMKQGGKPGVWVDYQEAASGPDILTAMKSEFAPMYSMAALADLKRIHCIAIVPATSRKSVTLATSLLHWVGLRSGDPIVKLDHHLVRCPSRPGPFSEKSFTQGLVATSSEALVSLKWKPKWEIP